MPQRPRQGGRVTPGPFKLRNSKWFSVSSLTIIEYSLTEVIDKLRTVGLQTVGLVGLDGDGASVIFVKHTGVGVQ